MLEAIFFLSLFFIFYVYAGYPFLVFILGSILNRNIKKKPNQPSVTILIPAYNEQDCIEGTIKNKLDLDYPKDKLEIIVISDGSTDETEKIVKQFEPKGVRLLTLGPRAGKTSALNLAVPQAKGEIIVFSDANSMYAGDALQKLTANFNDPSVGYVTGHMVYTNPDGTLIGDGCSAYMKYENFLRKFETKICSIVGVDGGIDAVRKDLFKLMNPEQLPDFVLPLSVAEQGYRVVYEPDAVLQEAALKSSSDEYQMRVRVSLRAFWALFDKKQMLFSFTDPVYAWEVWSHKILRYSCFVFFVAVYISNFFLWPKGIFFQLFFLLQNLTYLAAAVSPILQKKGINLRFFFFANYFALLNIASCHACIKFLLGRKQVLWVPRKG